MTATHHRRLIGGKHVAQYRGILHALDADHWAGAREERRLGRGWLPRHRKDVPA